MEKKQSDLFKKRLEDRQRELRCTMKQFAREGRDTDLQSAQDVADRAANSYAKEFLFNQSTSEKQSLRMVETALSRIREGVFGRCVSCGQEINPKRLEAIPWTLRCFACQELLETELLEHVGA